MTDATPAVANTVLVTGAAGFVGSFVAARLAAMGQRVVGCDNFNDYYDPQLKRDRVQALERIARQHGYGAKILGAVEAVNDAQKSKLFELLSRHYGGALAGKTVAVWGLAFKPNTDDMREAPSRTLLEQLWAAGARVRAHDPEAKQESERIFGKRDDLVLCDTPTAALEGADALVLVTEWKEFRNPEFDAIKATLKQPLVFDGRNIYDPALMELHGIEYSGIGRAAKAQTA